MRRLSGPLAALLALCTCPRGAAAYAEIEVRSADDPGEGFNDPTPVDPVGGNTGTTRGEQRMIAVQHAADLWGELLDSAVPIVIEAVFEDIGCTVGAATTLAYAGAASMELGITNDGANPNWIYPAALADRLEGSDLRPGEPDILATFNESPGVDCVAGTGWYYGLDARHDEEADLVNVALHELGHGLGFHAYVDHATGELISGLTNAFTAHLFDVDLGLHYHEMTDAQRLASLTSARKVVWDGAQVTAEAADTLESGTPVVDATPEVAGLTGLAGDATFGGPPLAMSVSAALVVATDGCPFNDVAGRIVLLRADGGCAHSVWAAAVETMGALGILMDVPSSWTTPPLSLEQADPDLVQIPVLTVTSADADLLTTAAQMGEVTVHLSHEPGLRGADGEGRVLMNVTDPETTSSLSHWDTLARPNLLMEPLEAPHTDHSVNLARALLVDIGWTPFCGNERLDQEEECDDGADNDDSEPDACRSTCAAAHCGDAVLDTGEACDDGADNSDSEPDACRGDCMPARCGDGAEDTGEGCDDGADNSDSVRDACRSDCSTPRCGDAVADTGEDCDSGPSNSDTVPDACRSDCAAAGCGDSVVDSGETCDNGASNSDTAANACRSNCMPARCGDGVTDQDEGCDSGASNSDTAANACRSNCMPARCGDGVIDAAEMCDAPTGCAADCAAPLAGGGGDGAKGDDDGCGCRVPGGRARSTPLAPLALACALAWWCSRRRRR